MAAKPRIRLERKPNYVIARLLDRDLFDTRAVREVSDQLLQLGEGLPRGSTLIIELSEVQTASSTWLGRMILVHRRIEAGGGRLVLCGLNESLGAAFRASSLDHFFRVAQDRTEAVELAQPR